MEYAGIIACEVNLSGMLMQSNAC